MERQGKHALFRYRKTRESINCPDGRAMTLRKCGVCFMLVRFFFFHVRTGRHRRCFQGAIQSPFSGLKTALSRDISPDYVNGTTRLLAFDRAISPFDVSKLLSRTGLV